MQKKIAYYTKKAKDNKIKTIGIEISNLSIFNPLKIFRNNSHIKKRKG